jgi:hypothetical protein
MKQNLPIESDEALAEPLQWRIDPDIGLEVKAEVERLKHQLPVIPAKTEHPMLKFAGIFKDDGQFNVDLSRCDRLV